MCKRLLDLSLSSLGIIVVWPLMLFISIAVYLDSPGPVIFSQIRLGRFGKHFRMHKFRKFPSDWGTKGVGVTTSGDARMTSVGRLLERTKLDELPQLWNVFIGEMSFVGPRPESTYYAELFKDGYERVLDYLPGIFGPNQVAFRNESAIYPSDIDPDEFYRSELFPQKVENDLKYFKQATCLTDIKWIAYGLWASIAGVFSWQRIFGLHGLVIAVDFIAIEVAIVLAYFIRFDFTIPYRHFDLYLTTAWIIPVIVLPLMIIGGVYRHPIWVFSINDVLRLFMVVTAAWIFSYLIELGFLHRDLSIGIGFLGVLLVLPMMTAPRIWKREQWRKEQALYPEERCIHILLYGAGHRGVALASLFQAGYPNVKIVGFVDDSEDLRGRYVLCHKVMGSERDLATLVDIEVIDQIWISFFPSGTKLKRIKTWAVTNQIEVVVLPAISPFANLDDSRCVLRAG